MSTIVVLSRRLQALNASSAGVYSTADLAVIRTVVELARTLKLRTVVEGVETEGQYRAMRELGCDYGQGYHLCRPIEPENVPAAFAAPLVT